MPDYFSECQNQRANKSSLAGSLDLLNHTKSASLGMRNVAVFSCIISSLCLSASAATGVWSGDASGTWDTSTNGWSGVSGAAWDATNGSNNNAAFNTANLNATIDGEVFTTGISFNTSGILNGGSINLVGASSVDVSKEQNATINSILAGSASLTKKAEGTLILNSHNTYTGTTTVTGGVLSLAAGKIYANLGFSNKQITINGGGIIEIGGWGDAASAGFGQVSFGSDNILLDDGTIRYTGGHEGGSIDRGFTIGACGATLDAAGGANTFNLNRGRNFGIISKEGGALTLAGASNGILDLNLEGDGPLVKTGEGIWTLTGTNKHSGDTIVNGGTLSINGSSIADTSNLIINAGKVELNGAETVKSLYFGRIQQAAGTYRANGKQITGKGSITVLSESASPYQEWANSFLPENNVLNPLGDNDKDGVTNRQEFAYGLSPISGTTLDPAPSKVDEITGQFTYTRYAASGMTYKILTSATNAVGSWKHDAHATQIPGQIDDKGNQIVSVTMTGTPLAASKLFIRVTAEKNWLVSSNKTAPTGDNSFGYDYSGNSYVSYLQQTDLKKGFSIKLNKPEANQAIYIGLTVSKQSNGAALNWDMITKEGNNPGMGIILTTKNNGINVSMRAGGKTWTWPKSNVPFIDNFNWDTEHVFSFEPVNGKKNLHLCIDGIPCDPEADAGIHRKALKNNNYKCHTTIGTNSNNISFSNLRFISSIFSVKEKGAVGNGIADDGAAINATIHDAVKHIAANPQGSAIIKLEKNTIYKMDDMGDLSTSPGCALSLQKTKNIALIGDNSTIKVANKRIYVDIADSDNIKITGINFDMITKPSVRGKITALDSTIGTMDVETLVPLEFEGNTFECNFFCIPEEIGRGHTYIVRYDKLPEKNTYRIHFKDGSQNYRFTNKMISIGQYYHIPVPNSAFTQENSNIFSLWRNERVKMENCNIWSIPMFGFDIKFNTGDISFTNLYMGPEKEWTDEYGTNMGWRDGFHCKENRGKFTFKNCTIRGINDDAINIAATYLLIKKIASGTRFTMSCEGYGGQYPLAYPKDEVMIVNMKTGEFIANTRIKTVYEYSVGHQEIEIEDSIPLEILSREGVRVMPYYGSAPGSTIKNCKFDGTLRFRSPVTVEDSELKLLQMWIQNDNLHECPVPRDILFKNCSIINHRKNNRPNVSVMSFMEDDKLIPQYKCKNIVFENCQYTYDGASCEPSKLIFVQEGNEVIFK